MANINKQLLAKFTHITCFPIIPHQSFRTSESDMLGTAEEMGCRTDQSKAQDCRGGVAVAYVWHAKNPNPQI